MDFTVVACQTPSVFPVFACGAGNPDSSFSHAVIERRDWPARNLSAISRTTAACSGMRTPPVPYPNFAAPCQSPPSAFCRFARRMRSALCPDS